MCKICVCFHARIGNFATIRNRISAATELSSGRRGWPRTVLKTQAIPNNSKQTTKIARNCKEFQYTRLHYIIWTNVYISMYVCMLINSNSGIEHRVVYKRDEWRETGTYFTFNCFHTVCLTRQHTIMFYLHRC